MVEAQYPLRVRCEWAASWWSGRWPAATKVEKSRLAELGADVASLLKGLYHVTWVDAPREANPQTGARIDHVVDRKDLPVRRWLRRRRNILLVLLLALTVRVGYIGLYYEHPHSSAARRVFYALIPRTWEPFHADLSAARPFSDQMEYDAIARNLVAGRGYRIRADLPPTAFRPPGYPLLLAGVYTLGGGYLAVRLLQLLLEIGTVLLLYAISRRIFRSEAAALLGAGSYAIYLPFVIYSATLFNETVYTFLLAFFVWLLMRARAMAGIAPGGSWRRFFIAGLFLGIVTLTKPTTLLLPFFLLIPLLSRRSVGSLLGRPSGWWRAIIEEVVPVTVGMCLMLTPWTIRNAIVLGDFVPVATGGGRILWECNYVPPSDRLLPEADHSPWTDLPSADREFYVCALRNIATHPAAFVGHALTEFVRLWFNLGYMRSPSGGSLLLGGANMVMMCLLAWALLFGRGPWMGSAMPLFLLLLYFSVVHMTLVGKIRYALPVVPYLMLIAAGGGVTLVSRVRSGGRLCGAGAVRP